MHSTLDVQFSRVVIVYCELQQPMVGHCSRVLPTVLRWLEIPRSRWELGGDWPVSATITAHSAGIHQSVG